MSDIIKLTKKQKLKLIEYDYDIREPLRHLNLYSDDFSYEDNWIQICESAGVDPNEVNELTIAYVGVNTR